MLFNGNRYTIIDEKYSYKCNLSKVKFKKKLNTWLEDQKSKAHYTETGVLGHLKKRRDIFRIYYRYRKFEPNLTVTYDNPYILGNIKKNSEDSCTVEYYLVYDNFFNYTFKFLCLICFITSIVVLMTLFKIIGIFISALLIILATLSIISFFNGDTQNKEKVLPAKNIFEDFLSNI